jgi:hypothetical protein
MTIILKPAKPKEVSVGDIERIRIDYTRWLKGSEVLANVDTPTEVGSSDLNITEEAINTAPIIINGVSVAIGKAVTFFVDGQVLDTGGIPKVYQILIPVDSDSSPTARHIERVIEFTAK